MSLCVTSFLSLVPRAAIHPESSTQRYPSASLWVCRHEFCAEVAFEMFKGMYRTKVGFGSLLATSQVLPAHHKKLLCAQEGLFLHSRVGVLHQAHDSVLAIHLIDNPTPVSEKLRAGKGFAHCRPMGWKRTNCPMSWHAISRF